MTIAFPPRFPATLARRPFLIKSLLSALSLIGLSVLYMLVLVASRLVGLPEDSPLSLGISIVFFVAAIILIFGVFLYIVGISASRCRSIGLSPWCCLIYFIPYANVLFYLLLAAWPPQRPSIAASSPPPGDNSPVESPALEPIAAATAPTATPGPSTSGAATTWKKHAKTVVGIVLIIGSILVGRALTAALTSTGNGTATERAQALLSSKEHEEYVSPEHGFRTVFPGFPEIERDTLDVEGYAVPYTFYVASVDADADARAVFVYDYSVATNDPADIDVEGALNGMVQGAEGGQLVSTSVASLGGVDGLGGHYRSALDGRMTDNYVVLVPRDTKLYVALSIGIPKSEFDAFAGAFRFE